MNYSDKQIEAAARAAHEINRVYCREVMDDNTQLPWHNAPAWARDSAIDGARAIAQNPDLPPSASHEGWMAQKVAEGWVYGEEKDPGRKTHPCLVPFDELPLGQRLKDTFFGLTVRAVLGIDPDNVRTDPGRKPGQIGQ